MDLVTVPFRGVLADWAAPVEAVLYDLARRHGESPLDRGRALRRRLQTLAIRLDGSGGSSRFAAGYDALVAERGYQWAGSGASALQRLAATCRIFEDVVPALEAVTRAGLPVVVVGDADPELVEAVLRPVDGAIDDVVTERDVDGPGGPRAALACALRRTGVPPRRALHVCVAPGQLRAARELGVPAAWLNRTGAPAPPNGRPALELRSLADLVDVVAGQPAVAAG